MQGMSFKYSERRDEWRCCFCCHVRTVTIILGLWHLLLHVLTLTVILVMLRNPSLAMDSKAELLGDALPTPLAGVETPRVLAGTKPFPPSLSVHYQELNVGMVATFFTFIITFLMVYGAIKGRPSYLMPFFCLQIFDFCISSLTSLRYLCYLPDMHRIVADTPSVPFRYELLKFSPQHLALIVLFVFTIAMLLKAYFIGVVWSCYKYLTLRVVASQRTVHLLERPPTDSLLPPDYHPSPHKFPTPPPSYAAATQP